jgi:4-amino-4-deoxy-L-arabinose transferase-like glycosyltransferase
MVKSPSVSSSSAGEKHSLPVPEALQRLVPFIPLFLLVIGLGVRLLVVLQPMRLQIERTLPDDAFYYYTTAQNILAGRGPSMDGLNPSNGWHPLWMILLLPIFAVPFSDPDIPVRLALILSAALDSLVAVIIYRAARRYISQTAGLAGGLAYALNGLPIFQSVNGLETGLSAFLVAAAWSLSLALIERPSWGRAAAWGGVFGLCFLGRTDTALILIWLGLWVLFKLPREGRWRRAIVGAAVAAVVCAPWLIWNQITFGSALTQSSAIALPWTLRARHHLMFPDDPLWKLSVRALTLPAGWLRGEYLGTPPLIFLLLWPMGVWGLILARKGEGRPLMQACLVLLAGGLSLLIVHAGIRLYPRPWYFVVTAQSLALALALFWEGVHRLPRKLALFTGAWFGMLLTSLMIWQQGYHPWQVFHLEAADWIKRNTPPDTLIGAWNAGIMGYYSGRQVVNLDGVVNPAAFEAIQAGRLMAYIRETGIDYVIDSDWALQGEYGFFMGSGWPDDLHEAAVIGGPDPTWGYWRVYRVAGSAER